MKKTIIIFAAMALHTATLVAQIPNNGFENWTSMGSYNDPDDWDNLNSVTNFSGIFTCTKGTPGSPGTAYIKLTSKTVTGMGVVPGVAATGILDPINMTASGFAYSARPQNLTGKWQYMAGSTADQGFISVILSQWNGTTNSRDTVAYAHYVLPGMVMSWANFTIPLTYKNGNNPDTAVIILSASGSTPVASSYLYIDNLAFSGSVAGMKDQSLVKNFHFYPNPATGIVEVAAELEKSAGAALQLFNMSGALLKEQTVTASGKTQLDVSHFSKGIYLLKITSGMATETKKLVIE